MENSRHIERPAIYDKEMWSQWAKEPKEQKHENTIHNYSEMNCQRHTKKKTARYEKSDDMAGWAKILVISLVEK